VQLSWGHDEYLYQVTKSYLPESALYMIRYHSFYPGHKERAYDHLMNDLRPRDVRLGSQIQPYDLYRQVPAARPDVIALKPYYEDLIAEYFPKTLDW